MSYERREVMEVQVTVQVQVRKSSLAVEAICAVSAEERLNSFLASAEGDLHCQHGQEEEWAQ